MKPKQFRELRESRNLTRDEMAKVLGVSASAIVQWERGTRNMPAWVTEKMLRSVTVTLPLEALALLLDEASRRGLDFSAYLSEMIRRTLAAAKAQPELRVAEGDEIYERMVIGPEIYRTVPKK